MSDNISPNTLLSFLTRKPSAAAATPEEEAELLKRQASILESLKATQPSSSTDLVSQALAGALPLIGGALAGDNLGLAAGASAGAGAVEAYRKQMEKEQEEKKTTSLLELANVQNRLDASALARQEAAKAAASLEKAKATTMLGQIEAAGGGPEDYLNYVRRQGERPTPAGQRIVDKSVVRQINESLPPGMRIDEEGDYTESQIGQILEAVKLGAKSKNKLASGPEITVAEALVEKARENGTLTPNQADSLQEQLRGPDITVDQVSAIVGGIQDIGSLESQGVRTEGQRRTNETKEAEAGTKLEILQGRARVEREKARQTELRNRILEETSPIQKQILEAQLAVANQKIVLGGLEEKAKKQKLEIDAAKDDRKKTEFELDLELTNAKIANLEARTVTEEARALAIELQNQYNQETSEDKKEKLKKEILLLQARMTQAQSISESEQATPQAINLLRKTYEKLGLDPNEIPNDLTAKQVEQLTKGADAHGRASVRNVQIEKSQGRLDASGTVRMAVWAKENGVALPPGFANTPEKAKEMGEAKNSFSTFSSKITEMKDLVRANNNKLPSRSIGGKNDYGQRFKQLQESIVNDVRQLQKMGANFTSMERANVLLQAFGIELRDREVFGIYNIDNMVKTQFGANPLMALDQFEKTIKRGYERTTFQNGYVDPSIKYDPRTLREYGIVGDAATKLIDPKYLQNTSGGR